MSNARPSWTGFFRVGTFAIGVQLVPASVDEDSPFVTVHAVDAGRVEKKLRCKGCATDVEASACVQGVEVRKGVYAPVAPVEIEALATSNRSGGTVELSYVRDWRNISPLLAEQAYFVTPSTDTALPSTGLHYFALFWLALAEMGGAAIGKIAFRSREWLAAVYVDDGALVLSKLRMPAEMREAPDEARISAGDYGPEISEDVKRMVELLSAIAEKSPVDLNAYRDDYTEGLRALVANKRGIKTRVPGQATEELKRAAANARRSASRKRAAA